MSFETAGGEVAKAERNAGHVAGRRVNFLGVEDLAVEPQLDDGSGVGVAEVSHLHERLPELRPRVVAAHVECGDGQIVAVEAADRQILWPQVAQRKALHRPEPAVAEDVQLDALLLGDVDLGAALFDRHLFGISKAAGQAERPADVSGLGRRLDAVQRLAQQPAVVGELLHHVGLVVERDDHGAHAGVELIDQPADALLGGVETRAAVGVARRHAGRSVHQENELLPLERLALPAGPQNRQDGQADHEQLEQQEQIAAEPLPQAVDVQVFDHLRPQIGAGYLDRLALELEEVQRKDRQRDQANGRPGDGTERVVE